MGEETRRARGRGTGSSFAGLPTMLRVLAGLQQTLGDVAAELINDSTEGHYGGLPDASNMHQGVAKR